MIAVAGASVEFRQHLVRLAAFVNLEAVGAVIVGSAVVELAVELL